MISIGRLTSIAGLGLLLLGTGHAYNLRDVDECAGVPADYDSDYPLSSVSLPELALSEPDLFAATYSELNEVAAEALGHVSYSYSSSFSSFFDDDKEKCKACVKKTSKKVMCYALDYLKKLCSKTKCPRLKKYCKIMETHKNFTYGFIWEKIHPLSLGGAYCCGHGECKIKPSPLYIGDELIPADFKDFVTAAANESLPAILAQQDDEEERSSFFGFTLSENKGKKCKDCLHHSIAFVMHHMFKEIEQYCHKTKDPRVQKICKFIETHKQVATGFIYGAVEPWKYAKGYCYGTKKCKGYHGDEEESMTLPSHISTSTVVFG